MHRAGGVSVIGKRVGGQLEWSGWKIVHVGDARIWNTARQAGSTSSHELVVIVRKAVLDLLRGVNAAERCFCRPSRERGRQIWIQCFVPRAELKLIVVIVDCRPLGGEKIIWSRRAILVNDASRQQIVYSFSLLGLVGGKYMIESAILTNDYNDVLNGGVFAELSCAAAKAGVID